MTVGILSDTHGLMRPQALQALEGVDLIVHAGDVGDLEVLQALEEIAPVHAVRGNTDWGEVGERLPLDAVVEAGEVHIYVKHIAEDIDLDPVAAGFHLVVTGHTHRPSIEKRGGVLHLNPGSCGPRRLDLPVTVARLEIDGEGRMSPEILHLPI